MTICENNDYFKTLRNKKRQEGKKEGRKKGGNEAGKEGRKQGRKEGRRKGGKEGTREGGKEGKRDRGNVFVGYAWNILSSFWGDYEVTLGAISAVVGVVLGSLRVFCPFRLGALCFFAFF